MWAQKRADALDPLRELRAGPSGEEGATADGESDGDEPEEEVDDPFATPAEEKPFWLAPREPGR